MNTTPWRRIGEWKYSSTHSLTSELDGGEWLASRPERFTPRERAPGTQCTGGWMGPRAILDAVVKRKITIPRRESNPRTPIVQPVAQRYTDWAVRKTDVATRSVISEPWLISHLIPGRSMDFSSLPPRQFQRAVCCDPFFRRWSGLARDTSPRL
jgi:hypothetical protein